MLKIYVTVKSFSFSSAEELVEAAEQHVATSPVDYQQSVRLYFIARYLVAMFESLVFRLPIQVWNEYRNALDHFMRYISHPNSETKLNLRRMEGHIQRAVLDMCKIICIRIDEKLEKQIESDSVPCLRLVGDNFYERLLTDKTECLRQLAHAKTIDHGLGENVGTNMEIVKNYLAPALGMLALWRRYEDNRSNIEKIAQTLLEERRQERHNTLEESSKKWYSATNLKNHLFPKLIWVSAGAIIASIWHVFFH